MKENKIYFRRKLPHYQPAGATFFITFRLAGSLPNKVVELLKEERKNELSKIGQDRILSYKVHKKYFAKYDEYLDRAASGPVWLQHELIAKIVADALHYYDGKRYELLFYCIMPNHVHLVISVGQVENLSYILSPILHSIKRYTAREANKILDRSGAFWQHESYDHVVRDNEELLRIGAYVLNNPVKAGLVKDWQQWKWFYINREVFGDEFDDL